LLRVESGSVLSYPFCSGVKDAFIKRYENIEVKAVGADGKEVVARATVNLALSKEYLDNPNHPVTSFEVKPEYVNKIGEVFLQTCYRSWLVDRFLKTPEGKGNTAKTSADFLILLGKFEKDSKFDFAFYLKEYNAGRGSIPMPGINEAANAPIIPFNEKITENTFDPKKGFTYMVVDFSEFNEKGGYNAGGQTAIYLGINKKGGLVSTYNGLMQDMKKQFDSGKKRNPLLTDEEINGVLLGQHMVWGIATTSLYSVETKGRVGDRNYTASPQGNIDAQRYFPNDLMNKFAVSEMVPTINPLTLTPWFDVRP